MDIFMCNKCFSPTCRGKQPYHITQCAHIFCQDCIHFVEKQCPQCHCNSILSLPLKEPLNPKVAPFFVPISETLESLIKVDTFRRNQLKISMQRFCDLDKKYEILKSHYIMLRRDTKVLMEKYCSIKSAKEKLDKKLLFLSRTCNTIQTPTDSGIFVHPSSSGRTSESLKRVTVVTPSTSSMNSKKQYENSNSFCISNNRTPSKFTDFYSPYVSDRRY